MWWCKTKTENATASFEALSAVCDVAISAEGSLDVILHGPTLTFEGLRLVIDRLECSGVHACLQRVTFDFGEIEEIQTPWTAVLALLIRFARRSSFTCTARNLSGQPANVFSHYRRSNDLMQLLTTRAPQMREPVLRRAG